MDLKINKSSPETFVMHFLSGLFKWISWISIYDSEAIGYMTTIYDETNKKRKILRNEFHAAVWLCRFPRVIGETEWSWDAEENHK